MGKYKYHREPGDVLRRREVEKMIESLPEVMPLHRVEQFRALFSFLYLFGCRIGEARMMRAGDIRAEGEYLVATIPSLKKRKRMGPFTTVWRTLKVPLSHPFAKYVWDYVRRLDPEAHPFQVSTGNPKTEEWWVWRVIKAVNQRCSPHLFRHSRLTLLALRGGTGIELAEWAGHTDLRSVANYLHVASKSAERLADKVE